MLPTSIGLPCRAVQAFRSLVEKIPSPVGKGSSRRRGTRAPAVMPVMPCADGHPKIETAILPLPGDGTGYRDSPEEIPGLALSRRAPVGLHCGRIAESSSNWLRSPESNRSRSL